MRTWRDCSVEVTGVALNETGTIYVRLIFVIHFLGVVFFDSAEEWQRFMFLRFFNHYPSPCFVLFSYPFFLFFFFSLHLRANLCYDLFIFFFILFSHYYDTKLQKCPASLSGSRQQKYSILLRQMLHFPIDFFISLLLWLSIRHKFYA